MLNTLIVMDDETLLSNAEVTAISFERYLADYPKKDERKTRVINLCDTAIYLSRGYYCSLLAEARQHKVLPSVNTINDLRSASDVTAFDFGLTASIVDSEDITEGQTVNLAVFFGWTQNEAWKKVARIVFDRYPSPILLERAVDHYAEGGFFNPAIALCNKILRQSPGRAIVYYKLGKISAEKGFKADARQNFLEYASRMQKAGNLDEAFRALTEFADLVPDQDDVRLMLADQLVKADRKDEAIAQLQIAYAGCVRNGRSADADAVAAKMKQIDPTVEPKAEDSGESSKGGGLVFLDLDPSPSHAIEPRRSVKGAMPDPKRISKAIAGLELIDTGEGPAVPASGRMAPSTS